MFTFAESMKICSLEFLRVLLPNLVGTTASEYGFMLKMKSPLILMCTEGVNLYFQVYMSTKENL